MSITIFISVTIYIIMMMINGLFYEVIMGNVSYLEELAASQLVIGWHQDGSTRHLLVNHARARSNHGILQTRQGGATTATIHNRRDGLHLSQHLVLLRLALVSKGGRKPRLLHLRNPRNLRRRLPVNGRLHIPLRLELPSTSNRVSRQFPLLVILKRTIRTLVERRGPFQTPPNRVLSLHMKQNIVGTPHLKRTEITPVYVILHVRCLEMECHSQCGFRLETAKLALLVFHLERAVVFFAVLEVFEQRLDCFVCSAVLALFAVPFALLLLQQVRLHKLLD